MARPVTCEHCGTVFTDTSVRQTSRFCSRYCVNQILKTVNTKYPATIEKTCGFCGVIFQASHKKVRQGKGVYCSISCRAKMAAHKPVEARFWSRVNKLDGPDAC